MESIRNKVLGEVGTNESVVEEIGGTAMHWRKPLSIMEVNQLAPTAEVRERQGRA